MAHGPHATAEDIYVAHWVFLLPLPVLLSG